MFIPIPYLKREYSARVRGRRTIICRCVSCGHPCTLVIEAEGIGIVAGGVLHTREQKAALANEDAAADLHKKLDAIEASDPMPYPCPKCGSYQPGQVERFRSRPEYGPRYNPNKHSFERVNTSDAEVWRLAASRNTAESYRHYLDVYPDGQQHAAATKRFNEMSWTPREQKKQLLMQIGIFAFGFTLLALMVIIKEWATIVGLYRELLGMHAN